VGQRRDSRVEILKGVAAGDMVVTAGQLKIRDGTPVTFGAEKPGAGAIAAPKVPPPTPAKADSNVPRPAPKT